MTWNRGLSGRRGNVREKLIKLLDVKSIVTFALIAVVCIQAVRQNVSMPPEFVASIVTAIVTYYFTRKDDADR